MLGIVAVALGLWPQVEAPPGEAVEVKAPLAWSTVGPEGGTIAAIYAFGSTGDTVVAVTWPNLWMSEDRGATWSEIAHYALFSTTDGTMAGDGSLLLCQEGGVILRSVDYGITWDTVFADSSLADMIISQDKIQVLYAAARDTINHSTKFLRSTNNGASWSQTSVLWYNDELYYIAASPSNPSVVYFAYGDSLSTLVDVSTDGGVSWTNVISYGLAYPYVSSIAVDPQNDQTAFVAFAVEGFPRSGVLKITTDQGTSWAVLDSAKLFTHLNTYQDTLLLAASAIPEGIKRFRKDHIADTAWLYTDECVISTDDAGGVLYGATDGVGVIRSLTDGATWDEENSGLYGVWGATPHHISAQGNVVYVLDQQSGRLYKSTDNGLTWTRNALNPVFEPSGLAMGGLAVHAATQDLVYVADASFGTMSVFYRSTDGGATWTPGSILNVPLMFSLKDAGGDTLYGLGWNLVSSTSGIFKSIDRGASWNLVYPYPIIFYMFYPLGDIAVSSWGDVFFTDTLGIIYSSDGGTSWNRMNPNLELAWWADTTSSAVLFTSSDTNLQGIWSWDNSSWQWLFYGGNEYGPLLTLPDVAGEDGGRLLSSWPITSVGIASVVVSRPHPDSSWSYDTIMGLLPSSMSITDNAALLGTLGYSYMRAEFSGVSVTERARAGRRLSCWVAKGRLFLDLPAKQRVAVKVYDVSGRLLSPAFSGELGQGLSAVDMPRLAGGVYMISVNTSTCGTRTLKWVNPRR